MGTTNYSTRFANYLIEQEFLQFNWVKPQLKIFGLAFFQDFEGYSLWGKQKVPTAKLEMLMMVKNGRKKQNKTEEGVSGNESR